MEWILIGFLLGFLVEYLVERYLKYLKKKREMKF